MIKLSFMFQTQILNFKIDGRNVYYTDKVWKDWLRIIPRDENFIRKIRESRNKIPSWFIEKFTLSEQDRKEYEEAKTEEELADRIIIDCNKKGLVLLKKEYGVPT